MLFIRSFIYCGNVVIVGGSGEHGNFLRDHGAHLEAVVDAFVFSVVMVDILH